MKPDSIIQEILQLTTTSLSQRQFCETDAKDRNFLSILDPAEQLEAACWNGLRDELLPEIILKSPCEKKIYLWQVEMRKSYLWISMGVRPPVPEMRFTLDPYIFLCQQEMN